MPLKQPTLVPQQAARSATIRLGESTRAEVRAALGEPWLQSGLWSVEVYRADDKRTELGFMVAIVIPIPVGVFSDKRHGYVLVTYDTAGRVTQVSPGSMGEGMLAAGVDKWLVLRADGITFAVEPVRAKPRSTLLADSSRLADYLANRRHAAGCTLVSACGGDQGCPDQVAVDDGTPFDPSPITVLCAPDAPCPQGSRLMEGDVDGKVFFRVPVLHAIAVTPGRHHLRITSSMVDGRGEQSFECAAGEVLYGIVRSSVVGGHWWSRGTLQATVTLSTLAPEAWAANSLVLHRHDHWLVETERDGNESPATPHGGPAEERRTSAVR